MTVALVLDIGSSSVRAMLFDEALRAIDGATITQRHRFITEPPGASIIDAAPLRAGVEQCVDHLLKHRRAAEIEVVGLATFAGNLLGIDPDGSPITPVYTYADSRSADDLPALAAQIDIRAAHQRTGCIHHTAYAPARIAWLRRTQPETFAQVEQWVDFGAYLMRAWFGAAVSAYSLAGWNGLLNRADSAWDQLWLNALKIDQAALPKLADYDQALRGLLPHYAERWPLLRDVPFCPAVGDGASANIGSGAVDPSRIALSVGTTAALRVVTNGTPPEVPPGLWSYRIRRDLHLTGGATSEGGSVIAWARSALRLNEADLLDQTLLALEADQHGLTLLPLLAGERSPGWNPDATGALIGLRLSTTPLDILQAAMEAVALRLALVAEQLAPMTDPGALVVASGGALAASTAWAQIIADALDRPVLRLQDSETTARGTAILALKAIGAVDTLLHPPHVEATLTPRPDAALRLREARHRQQILYQRLYGTPSL
jgi:gluconokinase